MENNRCIFVYGVLRIDESFYKKLASMSLLSYSSESQKAIAQSRKLDLLDGISEVGWITDVVGVRVGHFTDSRRPTGCTVVLCDDGALCGVSIPGGRPGTRLTDMLDPVRRADGTGGIEAILLSGGSVYGLAAAGGVERYLKEQYFLKESSGAPAKVFVVPAAVIYVLSVGDWTITPNEAAGYAACKSATSRKFAEGCIGAGARVGMMGGNPKKTGLVTASLRVGDAGIVIGALAVVNASGDIYHPVTGHPIANSRSQDGRTLSPTIVRMREVYRIESPPAGTHTRSP